MQYMIESLCNVIKSIYNYITNHCNEIKSVYNYITNLYDVIKSEIFSDISNIIKNGFDAEINKPLIKVASIMIIIFIYVTHRVELLQLIFSLMSYTLYIILGSVLIPLHIIKIINKIIDIIIIFADTIINIISNIIEIIIKIIIDFNSYSNTILIIEFFVFILIVLFSLFPIHQMIREIDNFIKNVMTTHYKSD
jgi:hypothetical protein